MRILMLGSKEYPFGVSAGYDPKAGGGIEVHVEKLSKYLAREGHEVHIVTRRFPGQLKEETIREGPGAIHVYRTRHLRNRYLRAFSYNLLGCLKSFLIIRKHRIDIIHSHAVTAGFFGARLSFLTRTPMAFTPHGTIVDWKFPIKQILTFFQKIALKCAARIIFVSSSARKTLSWRTAKPSVLLTNAIDLEDYDIPVPKGPMTFLFLGRLEEVKGAETLIEAFGTVLKKHPSARLLVAGEGTIKSRVISKILSLKSKQALYLGWVPSRDALKQAHCFVLPSRERGQPVALLEAMAAGRTIITSLPMVNDGKTGLRCKPDDPEGLARIMLKVCRSPSRYRKLGLAARKEASKYTWKETVKLYEKEYEKILSKR